jgi:hypothetical protein
MKTRSYTIYDKKGDVVWVTPLEDEAWAKVKLIEGQYVSYADYDDESWSMDSETYYTRES